MSSNKGIIPPNRVDPYGGEQEDPGYSDEFKCTCGAKCADDCDCEWPQEQEDEE